MESGVAKNFELLPTTSYYTKLDSNILTFHMLMELLATLRSALARWLDPLLLLLPPESIEVTRTRLAACLESSGCAGFTTALLNPLSGSKRGAFKAS